MFEIKGAAFGGAASLNLRRRLRSAALRIDLSFSDLDISKYVPDRKKSVGELRTVYVTRQLRLQSVVCAGTRPPLKGLHYAR